MSERKWTNLTNDKGVVQEGIKYCIDDTEGAERLLVAMDLTREPTKSKTGKSYVIAYTGGGTIPGMGEYGGYFRGGCGLVLSDKEKAIAKVEAKRAELAKLEAELG